jgi:hypothetical protein
MMSGEQKARIERAVMEPDQPATTRRRLLATVLAASAALAAPPTRGGARDVDDGDAPKVMIIGSFEAVSSLSIPRGTTLIRTRGHHAGSRLGGAVYAEIPPPAGGADLSATESANGRWWGIEELRPDQFQFGARALGAAGDDRAAIQGAMDFLWRHGGGALFMRWLPEMAAGAYHNLSGPLYLRPNVSLIGEPDQRAKIKNLLETGGDGVQQVFYAGNFHPAFTQDLAHFQAGSTYYTTRAIAVGDTKITTAEASEAARFAVGDQVFITSTTYGVSNGFGLQDYGWLGHVTSVDTTSGVLGLDVTLDVSIDRGRISNLKENAARDAPLYFWADAKLANLDIENRYPWIADSASLRCRFENLRVASHVGVFGDAYQHCAWRDCRFRWSVAASEMAQNSLRTTVDNCLFDYDPATGGVANQGVVVHERARWIVFSGCRIEFGWFNPPLDNPGIWIMDAQHARITRCSASGRGWPCDLVYIGWPSQSGAAAFPVIDNVLDAFSSDVAACARYVWVKGGDTPETVDNGVRNSRFRGTPSQLDNAVVASNVVSRNFVERCWFEKGTYQRFGGGGGFEFIGNDVG